MAGVAGDWVARLRALARFNARAVASGLAAALVVAAAAAGPIWASGSGRTVRLHAGNRPPLAAAKPPDHPSPGSTPPPAGPNSLIGAGATGPKSTAPAAVGSTARGIGGVGRAAVLSPYGAHATRAALQAANPSGTQAPGPSPSPAVPPQPPGLGARLLPGVPPVVAIPGPGGPNQPPPSSRPERYSSGSSGYDISWPQCGQSYPPKPYTVAIVGVNDGQAFSANPCLDSEASWAGSGLNLYINVNSPTAADGTDQSGPAGHCGTGDNACLAYNYGYNAARNSVALADNQGIAAPTWWLDVETAGSCTRQFPTKGTGYWSCDTSLNSTTIQGAIDALRQARVVPGDYSTSYQWGVITGGYVPSGASVPNWIAGADPSRTSSWCSGSHDFGGGQPWILQLASSGQYDRDQAC